MGKKHAGWWSGALALGVWAGLAWLERRRPLRRQRHSAVVRDARNLAIAATAGLAVRALEKPATDRLTALVERRRIGLLKIARLPVWLETALAVALLDYTLYLWHVLTHKAPFLWRFHVTHHADLDMDASTALRFHFGEMTISVAWRAAQVAAIGVSPRALELWQTLLFVSILFHHSNVRLPMGVERRLVRFVVTPRMHGIHHSIVEAETNSNWSSGLTVWDRLHGTLRLDVAQDEITIGVPGLRSPDEVTLAKMLAFPFEGDSRG